jgi:type I site-specific restriction-modification system R (restriction) subunit
MWLHGSSHPFPWSPASASRASQMLNSSSDFVFIIDEAHQSYALLMHNIISLAA